MAMSLNEVISSLWSNIRTYLGNNYLSKNDKAASATVADKATQDASGNTITSTYATKVENNTKANDSDVVHKSGDETITGLKTFSNSLVKTGSGNWGNVLIFKNIGTIKSTAPDNATVNNAIRFVSSDYNGNYSTTEAEITVQKLTTGDNRLTLAIGSNSNTSALGMASLFLYGDKRAFWNGAFTATNFTGDLVGTATKATADASGNVITDTYATKAENALKANDSSVVHLTGDETINGTKIFTAGVVYTNMPNYAYNDSVTTNAYGGWYIRDKNGSSLASLYMGFRVGDNANDLRLSLKNRSGDTVGVKILEDGSFQSIVSNRNLGASDKLWGNVYATNVNASILNIPQNAIVLAFCSSAANNGSTVAGTVLNVANGGTGGSFTATTETLTGTYRALNTVVANGIGMFVKIA